MAQATYLNVEWQDGLRARVKVRGPALLPKLLGHKHVAWRRTIHTVVVDMVLHPLLYPVPLRHELTHVRQNHDLGALRFLWEYYGPGGRTRQDMEAEAVAASKTAWPKYTLAYS
jgi:hypothetical protein